MVYLIPLLPCFVSVFSSPCVPEGSSHRPLQYVDIVGGTALHIFNFRFFFLLLELISVVIAAQFDKYTSIIPLLIYFY